jgi:beta-glucanase (GH16 family)
MAYDSLKYLFLACFISLVMVKDSESVIKKASIMDCEYQHDETGLLTNGWKKIFEDQFDQNLSNWHIWKSGAYNHELQLYQPSNLVIHDGILAIEAKKEQLVGFKFPNKKTKANFEYSSGRIESKQLFSINDKYPKLRILARIKLPLGYGMWPAFWAYGTPYPSQGEIDFIEARGAEPQKYLTNFYEAKLDDAVSEDHTSIIGLPINLTNCYHVYEMEWSKDALISYFDGKLVDTKKNEPHIASLFEKREKLVLNLAVGGGFYPTLDISKIQTGTMYIDWVKVYASKN